MNQRPEHVIQIGTVMFEFVDDITEMGVYQHPNGGIFAIDASYIEQEAGPCFDPFEGKEFEPD